MTHFALRKLQMPIMTLIQVLMDLKADKKDLVAVMIQN
jgi:hypothetical protein